MVIEIILLVISAIAVISSLDFISKSISNFTHNMGIPEYLASTIILSFVIALPVFIIMLLSNIYNIPMLGVTALIGFALATITLVMGIFLLKHEVIVEYEGYRNSTFMWASALLFLVVSVDKLIDRGDAVFLLMLFIFYCAYMYYRTGKSKEYVYLKTMPTNMILFVPAIFAIILSCFVVIATVSLLSSKYLFSVALFSFTALSLIMVAPIFDIIRSVFKSSRLTFDNLIGNVVVTLTLIPAIVALINPIPYDVSYRIGLMPLLFLNVVCLSFAMMTRLRKSIHTKTGIALIAAYVIFLIMICWV